MTVLLYDTRRRQKLPFVPHNPDQVSMYVCGPTVYNYIHIGNARPAVTFDVLFRTLQRHFSTVKFVRNITDIDDKINKAAQHNNIPIQAFTAQYIKAYRDDLQQLNCLPPSHEPLCTDNIASMIQMITSLIDKQHAYVAEGHVLFDVHSMTDYGALSKRSQDELLTGARVEVAPYKKNANDFVLWKPSDDQTPGWDSPWGRGRPGWHIECSAMIKTHIGDQIDIHGGGIDLAFPHHENERAQSNCYTGKEFVNFWMHNGYLNMAGQKMSKSLGNFVTLRSLLEQHPGDVLRYALLNAHYRAPLEWSDSLLQQAKSSLDRFYQIMRDEKTTLEQTPTEQEQLHIQTLLTPIDTALCDDINTPLAIAALHKLAGNYFKAASNTRQSEDRHSTNNNTTRLLAFAVRQACHYLGLVSMTALDWFQGTSSKHTEGLSIEAIETAIQNRTAAKAAKDYTQADHIRSSLAQQGIILEDKPDGTQWHRQ